MNAPSRGSRAQRITLVVSVALFAIGAFWIGKSFIIDGKFRVGNPVLEPDEPAALAPIVVRAEITRVSEGEVARPGQTCELVVQRKMFPNGAYECNAHVVCGGKVLYGGPERGFFPCSVTDGLRKDVVGIDAATSRRDHDPAFKIDTRLGVLDMWDDESGELGIFRVEAEILSTQ